jgi:hypothetical protein
MKNKTKWPVQNLLARRQQQVLRRWLRKFKTLSHTEKVVCICESEVGDNLSDGEERSMEDLINFQEGIDESSNFQVGNGK